MARILSDSELETIEKMTERYPTRLAALLPALHLIQAGHGHITPEAEQDLAELLGVPSTRVREVVTFYGMFADTPQGRHVVKICRNLPCQLRGAGRLMELAEKTLGISMGETTPDGRVSLGHEECLASCGTGPMLWHNDSLVENLDEASLTTFLRELT